MAPVRLRISLLFIAFTVLLAIEPVNSQLALTSEKPEPPTTRILFLLDCSQSMSGYWESDRKINIARKFLIHTIDSLEGLGHIEMALRVYGHQSVVPPQDCNDTRLEVPFAPENASVIRQKLRYLIPKGTTPIANSLALCGNDFPECDKCRNVIVLITDGIEACDGDPCKVSKELQRKGIYLKPFIIGIGLDPSFKKTFECVGRYYNADYEDSFKEVLGVVVTEALNSTTAQVNLLDEDGNPTETNVNMTFFDMASGKVLHNYIHTFNSRGNPDTISLDPLMEYRLVVHTLPKAVVDNISVSSGRHIIIAADVPQGTLRINNRSARYIDLKVIVRKHGDMTTLNMQKINVEERYLKGKYDIEIPVLPRIFVEGLNIKQSTTTNVALPDPGVVTLLMSNPGYGSIYVKRGKELEWIYNINSDLKHETIELQPGSYQIVFRPKYAKRSFYTTVKKINVRSGASQSVKLF